LNGYLKKLVTGGTGVGDKSVLTSSLGLAPGSYNLVGLQSSDYATIVRDDGWDFNSSTDLLAAGGVTSANYNGGKLSGIANDAVLYLRVNPSEKINSAIFNKLTFKISPRTDVVVSFDNGSGLTSVAATKDGSDPDGDGIFQLDLSSNTAWNGQIQTFALSLNYPGGTPFEIDFVKVNNGDFSQNDTPPTTSSQSASLSVSAPPIIHIQQPDIKGGVAFKPWNYRPGDLAFSENLTNSPDPLLTGEPLSTYLPDTRLVGGIRGDFFKGTNVAGNDDPHDFLFFPYFTTTNNYKIDANEYRFFCAKMMIDREFDLGLGSVARLSFIGSDDKTTVTEEWGVISDRWSGNRWYEFCGDLTNFYSESDQGYYWKGEVKSFRLDPHEFHLDTCCTPAGAPFGSPINATYYLDYLKLRKMDESNGRYTLVFKKSDQDSTTTTTRFFYNRTRSTSGGLEIPSSQLNCEGDICIWDTSTIPEGSYWIYGEISDGTLTTSRLSTGQVKIVNTTSTPTTPVLSVESPQENQEVCSALQIKGYSLLSDKFEDISAVQVFIDGIHFRTITPTLYNPTAVNQYPLADSSNAGFDESHDISALNDGNHTIIIKSYSSDGGIKTESRTVVKRSGCMDRAISDPAPAGSPSPITNREDLAPGDGVVLGLEHSLNDLRFLISGTRNCQMIRLGISSKSGGPYQYIYANTDSSAINTSFLTALSENLPRYTASIISTKQLASLNRQIASIKKNSLKKSKVCKAIKNSSKKRACLRGLKSLNNKLTTLRKRVRKSSTHNGIIYYIADCDQGVYSSSEQQFNSKAITCPTGESCKSFTNINQWFNTVISKSRPK
jgi:hypothetical protein